MDTVHCDDALVQELADAIHAGDIQTAQNVVVQLANRHVKLNIDVLQDQTGSSMEKSFKITVQVEDRESAGASFDLLVRPTDTIADLKEMVKIKFNFPVEVQRWIIGKKIQENKTTLARCHVRSPTTVFLYLLPAHSVGLTHKVDGSEGYDNGELVGDGGMRNERDFSFEANETLINSKMPWLDFDLDDADKDDTIPFNVPESCDKPKDSETLKIGDRVVWPSDNGNEKGTVKWIGNLPEMEGDQLMIGVEFDNKVGVGTGMYREKRLFYAKLDHAALVPVSGLMRE